MSIQTRFQLLPAALRSRAAAASPRRIALGLVLLAGAGLGHVYLRLQVIDAGYAISRESRLRQDLEDQNQKLRLELLTRRDPALVERRARDELHMAPPDPSAIRSVRIDRGALADGSRR